MDAKDSRSLGSDSEQDASFGFDIALEPDDTVDNVFMVNSAVLVGADKVYALVGMTMGPCGLVLVAESEQILLSRTTRGNIISSSVGEMNRRLTLMTIGRGIIGESILDRLAEHEDYRSSRIRIIK